MKTSYLTRCDARTHRAPYAASAGDDASHLLSRLLFDELLPINSVPGTIQPTIGIWQLSGPRCSTRYQAALGDFAPQPTLFDRTNGQAIKTRELKLNCKRTPRASFCTLLNNLVFVSNSNTRLTLEQPRKFIRCSLRAPKVIKRFLAREILMTAPRIIRRRSRARKDARRPQ